MKNKKRIAYFGFGECGEHCLQKMLKEGADVVAVMCRENDRGQIKRPHSVFKYAKANNLNVLEFSRPEGAEFLSVFQKLDVDYILSVQYDRILKKELLDLARLGSLNLHFGPLPRLRGCFPTKWAIINGEPAGVTLHHILPGIDDGPVVAQKTVDLGVKETDASLYEKLTRLACQLFDEWVSAFVIGNIPAGTSQDPKAATYYPKRFPHDGKIPWSRDAEYVERFIRAYLFEPFPCAIGHIRNFEVQFPEPVEVVNGVTGLVPGEAVIKNKNEMFVGCGKGVLRVRHVKVSGKIEAVNTLLTFGNRFNFDEDIR